MKVVLFCDLSPNQWALAEKLKKFARLDGIVFSRNEMQTSKSWSKKNLKQSASEFFRKLFLRLFSSEVTGNWKRLMDHYRNQYPFPSGVEIIEVPSINSPQTFSFIKKFSDVLVLVSGTNLVRRELIEEVQRRGNILNLHTGISPYIKGGPNCTNWCLALDRLDLIGNTVMWIDPGIDSGDLIATERTPLEGTENFYEMHLKVMDHAHDLYVRSVQAFLFSNAKIPRISQSSLEKKGRVFLTKEWKWKDAQKALQNFRNHYCPQAFSFHPSSLKERVFPLFDFERLPASGSVNVNEKRG